jgi:hypothetical protein
MLDRRLVRVKLQNGKCHNGLTNVQIVADAGGLSDAF